MRKSLCTGLGAFTFLAFFLGAPGDAQAGPPTWVDEGRDTEYPDSRFLLGVGEGDSQSIAGDRARAEIAKRFKVDISSTIAVNQQSSEVGTQSQNSWINRKDVHDMTMASTGMTLEGVQIAKTWRDAKLARWFALAVLNRDEAAGRILRELKDSAALVDATLAKSDSAACPVLQLADLLTAEGHLQKWMLLQRQWTLLTPHEPQPTEPMTTLGALQARIREVAGSISVEVQVTAPSSMVAKEFRSAMLRSISGGGLSIARNSRSAVLLVKVALDERQVAAHNPDFFFWKVTARIEIIDQVRDLIVGASEFQRREGAVVMADAQERARSRSREAIIQDFYSQLRKSLMR